MDLDLARMTEFALFNILVVWDLHNVRSADFEEEYEMLQMAIEKKFPGITIHWKLFGNPEFTGQIQRRKFYGTDVLLNDIPPRQKKYERQADYVRVICADRNIMNCIFKFAKDHPPPGFVLLISADGDFCQSMQAIKKMGFTTVLSYDDVKTLSNALKNIVDCRYYLSGIISTGGFDKGPSKGSDFCLKREVEYFHPTSCKTVVFWDMDSIPIPAYMFQLVANRKVERFLAEREPTFRMFGTVTYNIYGFEWNLPDLKHRSGRGVTYKTTTVSKDSLLENVMIADIWTTVIDSLAPSNIVIYSTREELASTVSSVRSKGCRVIVCLPYNLPDNLLRDAANVSYTSPPSWRHPRQQFY